MAMKIAPTLQTIVNREQVAEITRRELRALLAVARASFKAMEAEPRLGNGKTSRPTMMLLDRALARLERVSGGGR